MSTNDGSVHAALIKIFWTWLLVGASAMSPLQVLQAIMTIVAIAYSTVQLWVLFRDRVLRDKGEPKP